jgi:hypothetical protein
VRSHSAFGQGSHDISASGVDVIPRIDSILIIDIGFNASTAFAVWSNNG